MYNRARSFCREVDLDGPQTRIPWRNARIALKKKSWAQIDTVCELVNYEWQYKSQGTGMRS